MLQWAAAREQAGQWPQRMQWPAARGARPLRTWQVRWSAGAGEACQAGQLQRAVSPASVTVTVLPGAAEGRVGGGVGVGARTA